MKISSDAIFSMMKRFVYLLFKIMFLLSKNLGEDKFLIKKLNVEEISVNSDEIVFR